MNKSMVIMMGIQGSENLLFMKNILLLGTSV